MNAFEFGYSVGIEKVANALAVRPLVGELMRRPAIRLLPNAVSRGATTSAGNVMKYLGAAGAGMGVGGAAGYALGKSQAQKNANALTTATRAAAPAVGGLGNYLASNATGIAGGIHGAYAAPAGSKFEGAARGSLKAPAQLSGGLVGAGLGAVHGIAAAPSRGVVNIGRGMDVGANAGTRVMDTLLGGRATGLGGRILRAPAQAVGAGLGGIGGLATAPIAAIGGALSDTAVGAARGARIGGNIQDSLMGGAANWERPAAKQAGMVGDMTQAVKKNTEAVAGKANAAAKTVANKAVDAGKKMQAGLEKWRTSK